MKHFFIRLAVFLAPIAALILWSISTAFYLGEAVPIPMMIRWQAQADETIVYQPWSIQDLFDYKFEAINQAQPSLMIMGSSRMTLFRAALANQDTSQFYNAGIPSSSIYEWDMFLEALIAQGNAPDVIILGLDLPHYNARSGGLTSTTRPSPIGLIDNLRHIYGTVRRISQYWLEHPRDMFGYLDTSRQADNAFLGLLVLTTERGFLWDGSRYVQDLEALLPEMLSYDSEILENRQGQFIGGETVNENALAATENILRNAQENNIAIIGLLPPYRQTFYEQMMASADFTYQTEAINALETLFAEYDVPFYNFTDPNSVGGSEDEMTDSWHFSDLLSLRLYLTLLEQHPDLLGQYSDYDGLATWLAQYQEDSLDFFLIDLP